MEETSSDIERLGVYALTLRTWLGRQAQPATVEPNPLLGVWRLSGSAGCLEFGETDFVWGRDSDGNSGNAYLGVYSILPGIRVKAGFILDHGRPDTRCFSVILHYTTDRIEGAETPVDRYGLFFVEEAGNKYTLYIYNHRTANQFSATRLDGRPAGGVR